MDGHHTSGAVDARSRRSLVLVAGVVLGVAVVGPALRPGALLNLDLVILDPVPVPPSVWGLGPELPRRLPYFLPLAWASSVLDGALVAKALMVGCIAVAFVGMHRLCRSAAPVPALGASIVYAAGPFLTTRLLTGHLGTALATALLPWSVTTLLHPTRDLRRTALWCAALGFTGINGGILALGAVGVGVAADRGTGAVRAVGVWLAGQLPWLVPGFVVMTGQDLDPAGGEAFATKIPGLPGMLRLVTGQGFWLPAFEVGAGDVVVPAVGAVLVVLAGRGCRSLPPTLRRRGAALAGVGLAVATASAMPVLDGWYADLASTTLGGPLREGHRVLPLFLVWLAPAGAMGASRWGGRRDLAGPVLLFSSVALAGSALFGFGGRLEPVVLPDEWSQARAAISADPGPVVTLPWSQYLLPAVVDGHLVHNPAPFFFGHDVVLPSGRGTADIPNELADPRIPSMRAAVGQLGDGRGPGALARLGVRWIFVIEPVTAEERRSLDHPDLDLVVEGTTARLYRLDGAQAIAVDDTGRPVAVEPLVAPLARASTDAAITWNRAGASGWMRGFSPAEVTDDGRLRFGSGRGLLWYWPAALALVAQFFAIIWFTSFALIVIRDTSTTLVLDHSESSMSQ